jgi:hypothetical protein
MSVLILTFFVWVVLVPVAVIAVAWVASSVGARRYQRAERRYSERMGGQAQVLRLPTADRPVRARPNGSLTA